MHWESWQKNAGASLFLSKWQEGPFQEGIFLHFIALFQPSIFCTCSSWVHTVRPCFFSSTVSQHCKGPRCHHQGITQSSLGTWICHSSEEAATTVLSHNQFFSQTYSCKVRLLISMQRFHILKFPPLCSMEKAAHTACKLFKSLSLCQIGLLSSQEMLLPPPAQRTSTLFKCSKSNHYSSWKEKNRHPLRIQTAGKLWGEKKDPGKKKNPSA